MKADAVLGSVRSAPAFIAATAAYLALAFCLGGASQGNAAFDLALELAAVPLLGWALFRLAGGGRLSWSAALLPALLLIPPALQLIPLPYGLWAALPGREALAADLAAAGLPPAWRPLSLTPAATMDALRGLIPFTAVFLAGLAVPPQARSRLWAFTGLLALASVALGALQVAAGPAGGFHLYGADGRSASGAFANRNHWAAWLAASMPILAWRLARQIERRGATPPLATALLGAAFLALLAGVAISGSRAGVVLAALGIFGSVALLWRSGRSARLLVPGVIALAAGVITIAGAWAAASRFGAAADDLRFDIWRDAFGLARDHLPFGAGGGSFSAVYAGQENPDRMTAAFVNQAHNDWIEIFVEYGVLALAPIAAAGTIILRGVGRAGSAGRFVLLALAVLLAASAVDYPLRTPALQVLAALLLATLASGRDGRRRLSLGGS